MTVNQVRTLSARRLYKAYKHSGRGIEGFAESVRGFHPLLAQTTVKQLTRWHSGQRPRHPELVVAAYSSLSGEEQSFFYTTPAEDDEEERLSRLRSVVGELHKRGLTDLAAELRDAISAADQGMSRGSSFDSVPRKQKERAA